MTSLLFRIVNSGKVNINNNTGVDSARVEIELSIAQEAGHKAILAASKSQAVATNFVSEYTDYGRVVRYLRKEEKSINLPLFAFYSIERTSAMHSKRNMREPSLDVIDSREVFASGLMLGKRFRFNDFKLWFSYQAKIAEHAKTKETRAVAQRMLGLLNETLRSIVPGFKGMSLSLSRGYDEIVISMGDSEVMFDQLSDGQRLFIGTVSDIVWRLVVLNPLRENPLLGFGVVLIDEVELHLHPGWQQAIMQKLTETFPNVQFIVSTHSPQVLTTVKSEYLRILNSVDEDLQEPEFSRPKCETKGRLSGDILGEVMGVNPRPKTEESQWLLDCYNSFYAGKNKEGLRLLDKVKKHFGEASVEYQKLKAVSTVLVKKGVYAAHS